MLIIEFILYTFSIIFIFRFFFSLISIFMEKKYLINIAKTKTNDYKDIYVLLPALREQKIVDDTLSWFSKINYNGKIKFMIITTEKEEYTNQNDEETTSVIVKKKLFDLNDKRFIHLHYPKIDGNKSSQLNYAIEFILNDKPNLEKTYISVYDFDSQPDLNSFEEMNKVANLKNNPDVINQVPYSYKNFPLLTEKTSNLFIILGALQQNIRSCGIEKFRLLIHSLTKFKPAMYCMGACMHIKLITLIQNGYFPLFVDDLTLGYRLSIKSATFAYLPSKNYILIPNKLSDYFNQSVLIFKGILTSFSEIKKNKNGYFWGKSKIFFEGIINTLEVTIVPYLIIVYMLNCIVLQKYTYLFFIFLLYSYFWSISSYINVKLDRVKGDNKKTVFLAMLFSPIWMILKTFGSFIYYKRYLKSKIFGRKIVYIKTER